jgi:hypothetical protein
MFLPSVINSYVRRRAIQAFTGYPNAAAALVSQPSQCYEKNLTVLRTDFRHTRDFYPRPAIRHHQIIFNIVIWRMFHQESGQLEVRHSCSRCTWRPDQLTTLDRPENPLL